ncbi:MAG: sigma-70 family RNA polymerase sigma factor [Proteobacteria bacterium]|nr:sigma-70 family RNA polymerase sigma factor [Pseudomonadota bacterium]
MSPATPAPFMANSPSASNEASKGDSAPASGELDELTLRRAQRGDDGACRALVVHYQRPVFALLSRMLGPDRRPVVEDLAQETFIQVFRSLKRFAPLGPARLSTWILTIASRRAVDELRRARPATEPIEDDTSGLAGDDRADQMTRRREIAAAIQRAIADLSPPYRAAFLLREYHGFEYAEISRALGIDTGTVKSRLARARAALRESLAEMHDG